MSKLTEVGSQSEDFREDSLTERLSSSRFVSPTGPRSWVQGWTVNGGRRTDLGTGRIPSSFP